MNATFKMLALGVALSLGAAPAAFAAPRTHKKKAPPPAEAKPAPDAKPAPKAPETSAPAGGMDLTQPEAAKPAGAAPTMSFDAVDVSGKSADRQKLEVAKTLFKSEDYAGAALASQEI